MELMDEYRDGLRRTAEAEARAMRREAMAYLALFALGQVCAAVVAVVLPRLLVWTCECAPEGEVRTGRCAPGKGDACRRWGIPTFQDGFL